MWADLTLPLPLPPLWMGPADMPMLTREPRCPSGYNTFEAVDIGYCTREAPAVLAPLGSTLPVLVVVAVVVVAAVQNKMVFDMFAVEPAETDNIDLFAILNIVAPAADMQAIGVAMAVPALTWFDSNSTNSG